jgi:hypothetical protein
MVTGKFVVSGCFGAILGLLAGPAMADGGGGGCNKLPGWQALKTALTTAVGESGTAASASTCGARLSTIAGAQFDQQWLGSRVISAQKANTGNAFSLGTDGRKGGLALSSANLFSAVQPGGSLYGLQASNPVETEVAYGNQPGIGPIDPPPANAATFGAPQDPMVGQRIGGINVFGGGLALYKGGVRVGGLGVSGDTSCTDHMVAWWTRHLLGIDGFSGVGGVSGDSARPDNIIFDIVANPDGTGGTGQAPNGTGGVGQSAGGFGHPKCLNNPTASAVSSLPAVQ